MLAHAVRLSRRVPACAHCLSHLLLLRLYFRFSALDIACADICHLPPTAWRAYTLHHNIQKSGQALTPILGCCRAHYDLNLPATTAALFTGHTLPTITPCGTLRHTQHELTLSRVVLLFSGHMLRARPAHTLNVPFILLARASALPSFSQLSCGGTLS